MCVSQSALLEVPYCLAYMLGMNGGKVMSPRRVAPVIWSPQRSTQCACANMAARLTKQRVHRVASMLRAI